MSYTSNNYGYNKKIMEKEFTKTAAACRANGMPEDKIEAIHRMMLDELNSDRRFYAYTQSYEGTRFTDEDAVSEGCTPLMKKFSERLSVTQGEICEWGRMDWIEDLDTDEIILWVKELSEKDIEFLTSIIVDGLKQRDVAVKWGVTDAAISKRMNGIRESLINISSK